MAGKNEIVITADASQLLKENAKIQAANEKLEKKYESLKKKSSAAAREEIQRGREIEAALKKAQSPAERYNATLKEYKKDLDAGRISQEQFNKLRDAELQKLNASTNSLKKNTAATKTSTQATKDFSGALSVLKTGAIAAAAAIVTISQENRRYEEITERAVAKTEKLSKALAIQAGLNAAQSKQARAAVLNVAEQTGVTAETAFGVSTQLISSGVSTEVATGQGLESVLNVLQASNAAGQNVDPASLVKSLVQFLSANNLDKTAGNLAQFGVGTQRLFAGTNLQLSGLTQLAGASAAISNQVTPQEQLAAFSAIVDVAGEEKGATGLRNVVGRLASSSANAGRMEALGEIGLQPADVDFVGENLLTVLDRVKSGVDALPEESRKATLTRIFGEEGESIAGVLLNKQDAIRQNLQIQQDTAGFGVAVQAASSGLEAAQNRIEVRQQRSALEKEEVASRRSINKALIEEDRRQAYESGGLLSDAGFFIANRVQDTAIMAGAVDRGDVAMGANTAEQLQKSQFDQEKFDQLLKAQAEQNEIQRRLLNEAVLGRQANERAANGNRQNPIEQLGGRK